MCKEYHLVDIWRIRNPNCNTFTHRENTRAGIVQYINLIKSAIEDIIQNTKMADKNQPWDVQSVKLE